MKSMADGQLQHVKINREEEMLFVEVIQLDKKKKIKWIIIKKIEDPKQNEVNNYNKAIMPK